MFVMKYKYLTQNEDTVNIKLIPAIKIVPITKETNKSNISQTDYLRFKC